MRPGASPDKWINDWSEEERRRYLRDRVQRLTRLLRDLESWRRTIAQLDGAGTLAITWTDHEGKEHDTLLTPTFLAGHARILHAAADDLINCGEEGQRHANLLFATLSSTRHRTAIPGDSETFHDEPGTA
jgi:P2-related tail formation protein